MSITNDQIENGRALPGALVYAPTGSTEWKEAAVTYLNRGGKTKFSALTGEIAGLPAHEVMAVKGTRYVENLARRKLLGTPTSSDQALLFPRFNVATPAGGSFNAYAEYGGRRFYRSDEIPPGWLEVVWEAYELAAAGEPLDEAATLEQIENAGLKRKKTDVLEREWFAPTDVIYRDYAPVMSRLEPFLAQGNQLWRG